MVHQRTKETYLISNIWHSMIKENLDPISLWAMNELVQTTGWKMICAEIDKWYEMKNANLLDVRANVNDYKYNEDQLIKEQLKYLTKLKNLPSYLTTMSSSYHEDRSNEL